jgi:hypothetical protein
MSATNRNVQAATSPAPAPIDDTATSAAARLAGPTAAVPGSECQPQKPMRGPRIWTEGHVRRELETFLADRQEWPRARDFADAGKSVLRRQVAKYGGPQHWAAELGVRYVKRVPQPAWPEDRIRRELATFLDGARRFPSAGDFQRRGRRALWEAIQRTGGAERWALEFGASRANLRAGQRRVWTERRIERQLRRFLAGRSVWPAVREFNEAGLAPLFTAVDTYGGAELWAARMGVRRRPPRNPGRPPRYWTRARIRQQLSEFCAGRDTWPTRREFQAAGKLALYRAAGKNGGIRWWADALGLPSGKPERIAAAA